MEHLGCWPFKVCSNDGTFRLTVTIEILRLIDRPYDSLVLDLAEEGFLSASGFKYLT